MATRPARNRSQLPSCYYEGYLEKRSFKDKTSRKLWTSLCGDTLFFYNEKRDTTYVEKLELSGLLSVTDDGTQDRNLDAARLNLKMKDEMIKFTAPTAEARELWKGYIRSVTELSVPSSLNLLPGQIHMLQEAVEREKERKKKTSPPPVSSSPYITLQADMPACYHTVSRIEAEMLLEREVKRGNLLLRPGSNGNFALTTMQNHDGSIFKHYRVNRKHTGGFEIDVENPVLCATLYDVINYFVERTDRYLIPLIMEEAYEKKISYIQSDEENGEKSVQQASTNLIPPNLPARPVLPRIPAPEPAPEPVEEEDSCLYEIIEKEKEMDSSASPPSDKKAQKKPIMPPIPAPRKISLLPSPPSSASSIKNEPKMGNLVDPLAQTISELKQKLEGKAKCGD
ncbi:signal-transducing adaptor protein 2-like isoform X2 [Echeneis naucrates]|uniref:signal-transducing adaptor protein 2-like isoform X2 n=1 Tax=Echeneis naucrates TaxID=173247 RepID=UPI001113858E|nr:signal-transducing adaptor protein 2-like isoform X2 [Echeneis naucrates]